MNKFESIDSIQFNESQCPANDNNQEMFTPSYVCEVDTPFQVDLISIYLGN
jgi:hypothetical protein